MNKKLAICSVYMAAEVVGGTILSWNNDLYAMLSSELSFLRDDGYICVLMGDFNGHIGNDLYGITGNHIHINDNGRLVRNFVSDNSLTLVNADQRRCDGLFMRRGHMSNSVLDLILEDSGLGDVISSLQVDTPDKILGGSDHVGLLFEVNALSMKTQQEEVVDNHHPRGPSLKNSVAYKDALESLIIELDWDNLDTRGKCTALQEALI